MAPAPARRTRWIVALAVTGLVLRLAVLWHMSDQGVVIADEDDYVRLSTSLLNGDGFAWGPGEPTSLRPPLYPAVLAGVWSLSGAGDLQAVRAFQIVLAALTAWLVYLLGRQLYDPHTGAWAATLVWLYPELAYANFTILTETLFTLLLVLFVWLATRVVESPRGVTAFTCGVVLGFAALTRSILWPLPILLCPVLGMVVRGPLGQRLRVAILVLVGHTVVLTPWAVRNSSLQGVVTIVDTMGGMNLRMGNYEHTPDDRMWDAVSLQGEQSWIYALTQEGHPAGAAITEGQKEKWAQRKAIAYMRDHPGITLRRALIKFADFWGLERTLVAAFQQDLYDVPRWVVVAAAIAVPLSCAMILLMGTAGHWLARPDWRMHAMVLLPIFAIAAGHTIVFGHPRYHVPLVPLFAIPAAALAVRWRTAWPGAGIRRTGAWVSGALLVAIWARQVLIVDAGRISGLLSFFR